MRAVTCFTEVEGVCPRCRRPNLRAMPPAVGPLGIRMRWRDEKGRTHSARVSDALQPLVKLVGLQTAATISGRYHTVPLDLRKPIESGRGLETGVGLGDLCDMAETFGRCAFLAPLDRTYLAQVYWSSGMSLKRLAEGLKTTPKQVREWLLFDRPAPPIPGARRYRLSLRSVRALRAILDALQMPAPFDDEGDEAAPLSRAVRPCRGAYASRHPARFRAILPTSKGDDDNASD